MGAGISFPPLESLNNDGRSLYRCPLRTTSDTIPSPRSLTLSQGRAKKSRNILIFQQKSNSKPWTTSWMQWISWKQATKTSRGESIRSDFHGAQIGSARSRQPWFDPRLSFNPAIHRTKQAQFHSAVVSDLVTHPLPPPHPELTKYFDPPKRVLKTAKDALEECKVAFKVKEGTYSPRFIFASASCFINHVPLSSSQESSKSTQGWPCARAGPRRGYDSSRPKGSCSTTACCHGPFQDAGRRRFSVSCREEKSACGRV